MSRSLVPFNQQLVVLKQVLNYLKKKQMIQMKNRKMSIYFNKMYTYIINQKQYMQTKVFLVALALILSVNTQTDWEDQDNWGGQCNSGTKQSPIDLDPSLAQLCIATQFDLIQFFNLDLDLAAATGQSNTIDATGAATVVIDSILDGIHIGGVAASASIQFHAPSEHTIRGVHADLQLQIALSPLDESTWSATIDALNIDTILPFSLEDITNNLVDDIASLVDPVHLTLAVLFEVHDDAPQNRIISIDGKINLLNLMSCASAGLFYRYTGSMTAPPCTEGVQWLVSRTIISITQSQLDLITAGLQANNNRDIQLLQGRTLRFAGLPCLSAEIFA